MTATDHAPLAKIVRHGKVEEFNIPIVDSLCLCIDADSWMAVVAETSSN